MSTISRRSLFRRGAGAAAGAAAAATVAATVAVTLPQPAPAAPPPQPEVTPQEWAPRAVLQPWRDMWHERAVERFGAAFQAWRLQTPAERAWMDAHPHPVPFEYRRHLEETCPPDILARMQAHVKAYRAAGGT